MQNARKIYSHRSLSTLLAASLITGLSACDVNQTQGAELPSVDIDVGDLPEYEIVKTDDGELPDIDVKGGQLPAFDVDWMYVDVGLTEATVKVPKLKLVVEEETVTIPKVDVDWPGHEDELVERRIRAEVEALNDGYDLTIDKVYAADDELVVVSRLHGNGNSTTPNQAQRLSDYIVVKAPDMDIEHYVIGDRPDRDFNDDVEFIDSLDELEDELEGARLIFERN